MKIKITSCILVLLISSINAVHADIYHSDISKTYTETSDGYVINNQSFGKRTSNTASLASRGKSSGLEYDRNDEVRLSNWEINEISKINYPKIPASRFQSRVIRLDTRSKIDPYDSVTQYSYPANATVLIKFKRGNKNFICSGALIGKKTVLTAGHCLHTGGVDGEWSHSVEIFPAYSQSNKPVTPYGKCKYKRLMAFSGWTKDADTGYDIGGIQLHCNIGDRTGWYGFRTIANPKGDPAIILGYPGDKPKRDQWLGVGYVKKVGGSRIEYNTDTFGGMSGSPIWYDDGDGPYIYGVHTHGSVEKNSGVRITQSTFDSLVSWTADE